MFTGIVEATGTVADLARDASGAEIAVAVDLASEIRVGESVAVDGCCLTALESDGRHLVADLSLETLARTTLGDRRPGDRVNIERAVALGDRLGGHLVQGHVDGVESVLQVAEEGSGRRVRFSLAPDAAPLVVPKGSVTIDGVSLTVAALGPGWFDVALVPHTLEVTTLGVKVAGDRVNVELDIVGKHVVRCLGLSGQVDLAEGARKRLGL
jgi:riboflavin synthase